MLKKSMITILAATTLLTGCQNGPGPNETVGTLGGGALGALAGSTIGGGSGRVAAAAVGGVLGAFLGGQVGRSMDEQDRSYVRRSWNEGRSYYRGDREYRDCYYDTRRGRERCTYYREPNGYWTEHYY